MDRRQKAIRNAFGVVLALTTIVTRWPIRARTFFEFDSINFAVAIFRFNLREVTPQMPGYILHVLLARLIHSISGDLNQSYIILSVALSVGAVLFLWRAAAVLRGERVATVTALLWLTTPLFWFHGAINSIYVEEVFYASVLLYLGLKWLRRDHPTWEVVAYMIAFSLAAGARQTSLFFFLPATIFLIWKRRPSQKILILSLLCILAVTGVWISELLREAGGFSIYLSLARSESIFKIQSVLFGNSWQSQFDLMVKVLFYFVLALGSSWLMVVTIDILYARRSIIFIRQHARKPTAIFVLLIAIVPLVFYFIVFFMKAGYLLNVVPSAILVRAVLVDQFAIWLAEREKRHSNNPLKLTRPIITRNVVIITSILILLNVLWFFVPWPGSGQARYNNENTRNSFVHGAVNRYENSQDRWLTIANRALEYTNISGIRAVDSLNSVTLQTLEANGSNYTDQVMIATWWSRWIYLLMPRATTYDIELDYKRPGAIAVGRAQEFHRINIYDSTIHISSQRPVLLLMRHDRSDFQAISRQVHLERLSTPEYLDIYRILDSSFVLKWGDRTFIK
jgi:hypothetical protein